MLFRIIFMAMMFLLVFSGCANKECINCPEINDTAPALENIWPHEDGNSWTYDFSNAYLSGNELELYENLEDVPSPTFVIDDLYADFLEPAEPDSSSAGTYRLEFDGMITTYSGVTAQHLVETISDDQDQSGFRETDANVNLLLRIMRARPDLRDKITAILREKGVSESTIMGSRSLELEPPIFLVGYAWEQNDDAIIGYGDIDTDPSWKYLDEDLSPGHSFVIQLVPSLSDDIFLHGKIMSWQSVEVDGITYENCVEYFYAIDFGIQTAMDEHGSVLGYYVPENYGTVVYAPEVGPVSGLERNHFVPDELLGDYPGTIEKEMSLIDFVPGQ